MSRFASMGALLVALASGACGPGSTSAGVPGVRLLDEDSSVRRGDAGPDLGSGGMDVKDGGISLVTDAGPTPPAPPPPPPAPPPPPGDDAAYCRSCGGDGDCDGGENRCLRNSRTGAAFCGTPCDGGCPDGAECANIGDGSGRVVAMLCVPTSGTCDGAVPPPPPHPPPPPPPDTSHLCEPCMGDDVCGGLPNRCLQNLMGETVCGSDCSSTGTCPADYECAGIGDGAGRLIAQQCVPVAGTCTTPPPPMDAGPPEMDAGPPELDAGPPETDSGPAEVDSASPEPDAS